MLKKRSLNRMSRICGFSWGNQVNGWISRAKFCSRVWLYRLSRLDAGDSRFWTHVDRPKCYAVPLFFKLSATISLNVSILRAVKISLRLLGDISPNGSSNSHRDNGLCTISISVTCTSCHIAGLWLWMELTNSRTHHSLLQLTAPQTANVRRGGHHRLQGNYIHPWRLGKLGLLSQFSLTTEQLYQWE